MKKLLLFLLIFVSILTVSCDKTDTEVAGKIPGMGNDVGKLQVDKPFIMPEGMSILGEITGIDSPDLKSDDLKPVNDSKTGYSNFGSGRVVKLKLTVLNSKNYARTIFFPKGLLWECKFGNFQHALQIQTTWVCLQANSSRTIVVDLYCVNAGLPAPNSTGTYKILGVTNSKVLWDLLNIIKWRKVNYEMIYGTYSAGKGVAEVPSYEVITERLQEMVWNLTNNGINISEDDKKFIETIPELVEAEIPQVDVNSQFPEYFEEFKVLEK